jgi:hypothetical protein
MKRWSQLHGDMQEMTWAVQAYKACHPLHRAFVGAGSKTLSEIPCRVRKLALLSREGQRRPAHIGEALPAARQRVIPREVQAPRRW